VGEEAVYVSKGDRGEMFRRELIEWSIPFVWPATRVHAMNQVLLAFAEDLDSILPKRTDLEDLLLERSFPVGEAVLE
jgi:hypothetical protein